MLTQPNLLQSPPIALPNPPWGRLEIIKAVLTIVLGTVVLGGIAVLVTRLTGFTPDDAGLRSPLLFTIGTGIYLLVILAVYLFAVRRPGSSWATAGLQGVPWWWVPAAPLVLFVLLTCTALVNLLLLPLFTDGTFENPQIEALTGGLALTPVDLLLLLFLVAVMAPIAEEFFFRGMLYPVMRRQWGATVAILLNGLLFALVHFIPLLIPALFFIGIVLTWLRERSGSVLPGILVHALQNGLVVILIYTMTGG